MRRRSAFTLTELLVAIGIIAFLFGLGVFVIAGRNNTRKVNDAAEFLQAKILVARAKAFSEQTPRGVRLLPGTVQDGFMHRLVYIEQATPISGGNVTIDSKTFPPSSGFYTVWLDNDIVTGG